MTNSGGSNGEAWETAKKHGMDMTGNQPCLPRRGDDRSKQKK